MNEGAVPYKRVIFVCANTRDGRAACGNAERGDSRGDRIVELLKEEVKARGLKKLVRVARSGCMDLCGTGPNAMVFDSRGSATHVSRISSGDVPQFVQRYLTEIT